jgi:hypothetical protein
MGIETSKALLARRRESTERISRLVTAAEERSPAGAARRQRITQSVGLARRRLRALAAAQRAASALEVEIGQVLVRLEAEGMSRKDVFQRLGLPRHVGRKYLAAALAAQNRLLVASSTDAPIELGAGSSESELGPNGTRPGATHERQR